MRIATVAWRNHRAFNCCRWPRRPAIERTAGLFARLPISHERRGEVRWRVVKLYRIRKTVPQRLQKENAMRRRDAFKLAASGAMLALPHVARAQRPRTLKYVPGIGLTLLDPVWSSGRNTHIHAHMVFDTLYGRDETLTPQPTNDRRPHSGGGRNRLDAAIARRFCVRPAGCDILALIL
jgi:hypothetical protein